MSKTISISQFQMNATMSFIMISIVNLFISFITAEHVYSGNTLVPYSVILVSTFVGLEVLLYLFVVPLSELVDSWDRKRKGLTQRKSFVTELPVAEEAKARRPVREEKPVDAAIQAIFDRSDAQNREREAKAKEDRKELIRYYLYDVLAPLLPKDEIDILWLEFESWIEHSAYHPIGRNWKWTKDVKPVDVRHLVWNIAKRLGMDKGYNVEACACFIVRLFPDVCENIRESTIRQTLKQDPDKGHIKIDEPDPNSPFKFHTDTEQE